jgi:nicotinate-nucleotide adenylyltransferase
VTQREVAVFGGSFNPPHVAHVFAASWVLSATRVQSLIVVPTFQHPFHKAMAPFEQRLAMTERAFADLKRVTVSRVEAELGGDSYTLRTLEELQKRMPDVGLRLVVGEDLLAESSRWHAFDRVIALAPLLVLGREGHRAGADLAVTLPEVSSTEVRRRLHSNEPVEGIVPASVMDYIAEHRLYRTEEEGA